MANKRPTSLNMDPEVRDKATAIFNELGLSLSQAVDLYLRAVIRENGIPFDMTISRPKRRLRYEDDDLDS